MGDPEFHEIEDQLFDAIVDSGYRAVIKNGDIYLPDPNGTPGELILVDPAEPEDLDDPTSPQPRRRLRRADRLTWHVGRGTTAQRRGPEHGQESKAIDAGRAE